MNFDEQGTGGPEARTRKFRTTAAWLMAGLAVIAVAAAIVLVRFFSRPAAPARPPEQLTVGPRLELAPPVLTATEIVIKKGETLSDILRAHGFTASEVERLKSQVNRQTSPRVDLAKIVAGRTMRFIADPDGRIRTIEYAIDDEDFLAISREGPDFIATRKKIAYETRVVVLWGTVEDNVIRVFEQRGETDEIAIEMTDLFAWDIDFNTELRVGDAFRIAFEKKYLEGRFVRYGEILAAEITCQGKTYDAFRFEYPDTKKADHFDHEGKSVRKEFLRSPLPYARVTSRFSYSRFHPILKIYTAHLGVDLAAPLGYPVHATADGTVTFSGPSGPSGNLVIISHRNGYETMYLHLQNVSVKKGDRVVGGKTVIGAVGSTGESTGPHLDYRIRQNGVYLNPLAKRFLPVEPLRPAFKEAFANEMARDRRLLEAPLVLREILSR